MHSDIFVCPPFFFKFSFLLFLSFISHSSCLMPFVQFFSLFLLSSLSTDNFSFFHVNLIRIFLSSFVPTSLSFLLFKTLFSLPAWFCLFLSLSFYYFSFFFIYLSISSHLFPSQFLSIVFPSISVFYHIIPTYFYP